MSFRFLRLAGVSLVISIVLFLSACHKKSVPVPPAAAPAPAKPTASLTVTPNNVRAGDSAQLSWTTQNATEISIDPLGTVDATGQRTVKPSTATTYTLTAKGPDGSVQATARVTVTLPPPAAPAASGPSESELFSRSMKDIYFNYDRFDVRAGDEAAVKSDADFLAAHPGLKFVISGHCDERGSEEYNMALGASRANAVRDELMKLGVAASRIRTISYGKEKPFCTEQDEACWQQNRRAHLSLEQ